MELECEKYREESSFEVVACNYPGDYCQFRNSCIIHFMEMENRREKKRHLPERNGSDKDRDRDKNEKK
jgi:hypothetical protein